MSQEFNHVFYLEQVLRLIEPESREEREYEIICRSWDHRPVQLPPQAGTGRRNRVIMHRHTSLNLDLADAPMSFEEDFRNHLYNGNQILADMESDLIIWADLSALCWNNRGTAVREVEVTKRLTRKRIRVPVQVQDNPDQHFYLDSLIQRGMFRSDLFLHQIGCRYISYFCCQHRRPGQMLIMTKRVNPHVQRARDLYIATGRIYTPMMRAQ